MSGICGWFATGPTSSSPDIEAMARALHPSTTGNISHLAVANCALAVGGNSSLYHDGSLWIAYQGAAYFNELELRHIAAAENIEAAVAESYRRKGVSCLEDIHGAFTIAIFDLRYQRGLVAIDRMGIQSLYLKQSASGIVFGTSLNSVIAHPDIKGDIDPQAVYDYLYFHVVPSPRSIYKGIEKLLPAQCVIVENQRIRRNYYWQMKYCDGKGAPQEELKEEFHELLRETVRRALAYPHSKAGNFLSGGTDSSTLAGIVTEISEAPAETYSIGFDAEGFDESQYADIAVRHFGTRHHNYYVTPQDVVEAIPLIAKAYDEPFGNASAVPTYYCAKMAMEDGVDLMIAGDGGDELFGGNARYVKQKGFELYEGLPTALRRAVIEPLAFRMPGAKAVTLLRKLQSYITQAKIPLPDRLESYNFLHRTPASEIFQGAFLDDINLEEPLENIREVYRRTQSTSALHRMLHLDLKNTLADNDLRKVNRMCAMAGPTVAYPLLDDAMVEFSGRVPPDLKIKGFALRYFFKESLRDFLPPEIIKKSKHGFGLPFGLWLNRHAPLRDLVGDSLQSLNRRHYINPRYIDTLLDELGREHASYYGVMIWVLVMLEQWLQQQAHRPYV